MSTKPQDWAEEKAKEVVKVLWFCNEETTEQLSFKLDQERVANAIREAEQRGWNAGVEAVALWAETSGHFALASVVACDIRALSRVGSEKGSE